MRTSDNTVVGKSIKSIVNLLIPVSCFLSFAIIWLLEKVIRLKFPSSYPELALGPVAQNLIYSGGLRIIAISGLTISAIAFTVWVLMLLKNKSNKHLLGVNKAVLTVLVIWAFGTLLAPLLLYLAYKPIFEPIIK